MLFIRSSSKLMIGFMVSAAALFLMGTGQAHAAIKTWAGTSVNSVWSLGSNWSPNGVPVDNDDIVFNCATSVECDSVFDMPGLIINSMSYQGAVPGLVKNLTNAPVTLNGNITSVNPGSEFHGSIILGTDITVNNTVLGALNLNTLSLTLTGKGVVNLSNSERWIGLAGAISGTGVLNINADADQEVYLSGTNTYSGMTNINGGKFVSNGQNVSNRSIDMFGVSDVYVNPLGKVVFTFDETENGFNFDNGLSFNRTNPSYVQFEAINDSTNASLININFTDVRLSSDTRFDAASTNGGLNINLLGITANAHCIEYGLNNSQASSFTNGPDCSEPVVPIAEEVPGVPDSGITKNRSVPTIVIAILILGSGIYLKVKRKLFFK